MARQAKLSAAPAAAAISCMVYSVSPPYGLETTIGLRVRRSMAANCATSTTSLATSSGSAMLIAKSMLGSASTKRAAVSTSARVARRRSPVAGSATYRQSGPLPVWPAPSRSSRGAVSPPRGRSCHERGALSSARPTSSAGMRTRVPSTVAPATSQRSRAPASFISTPVRASSVSDASWTRRQAASSQILSVARFTVFPLAWWSCGGGAVGDRRLGALSRAPPAAWRLRARSAGGRPRQQGPRSLKTLNQRPPK